MRILYSIRSRFFLAFLISAMTIVGTCSVSIFFSERLLSSVNIFIETTLPRLNNGSLLKTTARDIRASSQVLTTSTSSEQLNIAYIEIEDQLDRLEALTAEISQNDSSADILGLNWTSQAVRTLTQLLFQLTSQYVQLHKTHLELEKRCRATLARFPTLEVDPPVSTRKEIPVQQLMLSAAYGMITLIDRLTFAEALDVIDALEKEYAQDREQLTDRIGPLGLGPETDSGQIIEQMFIDLDKLFKLQHQEIMLRQSIEGFGKELDSLVLRLTDITSDHMRYVFDFFKNSAKRVIEKENKALNIIILFIMGAVLILFILYWRVVVRGFGNRLTTISKAMVREPANNTDTKVPVGGHDEIAAMSRSLEGLLEKALRLKQLATIDELTQIYNRRSFFELAEKEVEHAKRNPNPNAIVMMLDIDNFKSINDTFGHHTGDKVLYETAQICMRAIRSIDLFARIGGEEFALLMPNSDLEAGKAVSERIRKATEANALTDSEGNTTSVTLSIGLTATDLTNVSIGDALRYADAALYQAKNSGRNRVVVWPNDPFSHEDI